MNIQGDVIDGWYSRLGMLMFLYILFPKPLMIPFETLTVRLTSACSSGL